MQKTTRKSRIMSSVELSAAEVEKEDEGDEDEEEGEEEEEEDDDQCMPVSPRFLHVCVSSHSKGKGP